MRILGVVDLLGGRAVHARAGERRKYAPVASVAGDAVRLARGYLDAGVTDIYVADLNAIVSGRRQDALIEALAGLGAQVWLDAGITSIDAARACLGLGVARIVVGLETLSSFDALRAICEEVGGGHVVFSLDLRNGSPVTREAVDTLSNVVRVAAVEQADATVIALAQQAAAAGAGTIIVLDLARVGTGTGIDVPLLARLRSALPNTTLLAGGGVNGPEDLARLDEAGCDGALVATAFHDARIGPAHIAAFTKPNDEPRTPKGR